VASRAIRVNAEQVALTGAGDATLMDEGHTH
jgi:hypothetical protein